MKKRLLEVLLLILLVVGSFYFGTRVAYNIAKKRIDTQYAIAYKDIELTDVNAKLLVLRSLRLKDYSKATKALEDFVDVDLNSLSAYEIDNKVSDKGIEKIARYVKAYRDKYNDHKVNPRLEKSITDLLNKYNK